MPSICNVEERRNININVMTFSIFYFILIDTVSLQIVRFIIIDYYCQVKSLDGYYTTLNRERDFKCGRARDDSQDASVQTDECVLLYNVSVFIWLNMYCRIQHCVEFEIIWLKFEKRCPC